ncbi:hypothetical protein HAX54_050225 [Datura stramonium]|uniref:Uncharacterized protein n=1 Tax=Datura stramonium TaxID=4076 RepID=A0ABS8WPZ8_DATST|nr:hypothetical protein [Datura stramonium]
MLEAGGDGHGLLRWPHIWCSFSLLCCAASIGELADLCCQNNRPLLNVMLPGPTAGAIAGAWVYNIIRFTSNKPLREITKVGSFLSNKLSDSSLSSGCSETISLLKVAHSSNSLILLFAPSKRNSSLQGLDAMVMIYTVEMFPGAHFNPANMLLSLLHVKRITWRHVPAYISAVGGATVTVGELTGLVIGAVVTVNSILAGTIAFFSEKEVQTPVLKGSIYSKGIPPPGWNSAR